MEIYLLRHGKAEPAPPGGSDAERALTEPGRQALRNVLQRARAARLAPALILSSPYVRAVQTAELAAGILGYGGAIVRTNALVPFASPPQVWEEIRLRPDVKELLVVSHEPLLGELLAFLLGTPTLHVDVKAASLIGIQVEPLRPQPAGILRCMLTPALAAA